MITRVLTQESPAVRYLCERDERLSRLVAVVGSVECLSPSESPFAFLVHEIAEQMLSIKAAERIFGRISSLCPAGVTPDAIACLSLEQLRGCGVSSRKAAAISSLASSVLSGELELDALEVMSDAEVTGELTSLRGIGCWTAKMYLIFVLDREDVLPHEDGAFLQAYRWLYQTSDCSRRAVEKRCAVWTPHSSTAARFLYQALDTGLCEHPVQDVLS